MKIICPTLKYSVHSYRWQVINFLRKRGIEIDTTPLWGWDYYRAIKGSDLVLNIHSDNETYAGNLRLFEATGMGTALLTDYKRGLENLFELSIEILSFDNLQTCLNHIGLLETHPDYLKRLAKAGQQRTLREHLFHKEEWMKVFEKD